MEILWTIAGCFAASFAAIYAFAYAAGRGDIGDLVATAAANVRKRMPKESGTVFALRTVDGSKSLSFSWPDFFEVFKTTMLVGLAAIVAHISTVVLPNLDQSSNTGILLASGLALLFKFLSRWLPDTRK
jgi:hypothetical protein